jgi:hypothetical protein
VIDKVVIIFHINTQISIFEISNYFDLPNSLNGWVRWKHFYLKSYFRVSSFHPSGICIANLWVETMPLAIYS